MTALPLISVGLPAYNARETINRAIASVADQDWPGPIEIVLVDDGSTDGMLDDLKIPVRESFAVRTIRLAENAGTAVARNAVLNAAGGEYLAWIDADDVWYPNKLSVHMRAIEHRPTNTLSMAPFDWLEGGKSRLNRPRLTGNTLHDFLSCRVGAYLWTLVGRTETFRAVGEFSPQLRRLQDLDFMIRFAAQGGSLVAAGDVALSRYNKVRNPDAYRDMVTAYRQIMSAHKPHFLKFGRRFYWRMYHHHVRNAARFAKNRKTLLFRTEIAIRLSWLRAAAILTGLPERRPRSFSSNGAASKGDATSPIGAGNVE